MVILTDRDKKFLDFIIDVYSNYADDLGIQNKDEHEKLVLELNKMKKKWRK